MPGSRTIRDLTLTVNGLPGTVFQSRILFPHPSAGEAGLTHSGQSTYPDELTAKSRVPGGWSLAVNYSSVNRQELARLIRIGQQISNVPG
jgi:hypothetical protein